MNILKALTLCLLLSFSGQGVAKTIKIKFDKGQYCGIYQIDTKNNFYIYLKQNQQFTIELIAGIAKPYFYNGKGKPIEADYNNNQWQYPIKNKGKYVIGFDVPYDSHTYAEIKVCAY